MTKEEAKQKIIELIKTFKALDQHKIKGFNEAASVCQLESLGKQ